MLQPMRDARRLFADQVVAPADYIVFLDGGVAYLKNGRTGAIEYSSKDHGEVIQKAIDSLPTIPDYTEFGNVVSGGKYGYIHLKTGQYKISDTIVVPDGSNIKIIGDSPLGGQASPIAGTVLEWVGDSDKSMLYFAHSSSYGYYVHSRIWVEGLSLVKRTTDASRVTLLDLHGVFMGVVRNVNIYGSDPSYGDTGIRARSESFQSETSFENININGLKYGFWLFQNHISIHNISVSNCEYGIYSGFFLGDGMYDVKLYNNKYDLYVSGLVTVYGGTTDVYGVTTDVYGGTTNLYSGITNDKLPPIFISVLYLEHSDVPQSPTVITNGQRLIIGQLNWMPSDVSDPSVYFDNFGNVVLLSGRISPLGGDPVRLRTRGDVPIVGDGETTTFTIDIAHRLAKDRVVAKITLDRDGTVDKIYLVDIDGDGFKETLRVQITYATAPANGESVPIYWSAEALG